MASVSPSLIVDCSVVVKWRLVGEPHASEADELFLDWQHGAIALGAPALLPFELTSALLNAHRRGRISETEATTFLGDLLLVPIRLFPLAAPLAARVLAIASQHHRSAYDAAYVALAEQEGVEFWTGDQRLYNALHAHFPLIRWIADYRRLRP